MIYSFIIFSTGILTGIGIYHYGIKPNRDINMVFKCYVIEENKLIIEEGSSVSEHGKAVGYDGDDEEEELNLENVSYDLVT